jgi:hypothetical protein
LQEEQKHERQRQPAHGRDRARNAAVEQRQQRYTPVPARTVQPPGARIIA